ncbi:MAG: ABC transporter permease [Deltaproteobacteria bacterium]|nr:ABC transporter permease [Deltaproteobacteria bacterium]
MVSEWLSWLFHLTLLGCIRAVPLWLACLGGLISELSGVINFALEGMMLMGAFFAVWATFWSGSPWMGLLWAALGGCFVGVLHGTATLRLKANQIVSSIALNLMAAGITGTLLHQVFEAYGTSPSVSQLPHLGAVGQWLGWGVGSAAWKTLEGVSVLLPVTVVIAAGFVWMLAHSVWGLRIRACGENPSGAESAGLSVLRVRFGAVVLSGALAGLGGAFLSIGVLSQFVEQVTQGRGYLAVAAIILGRWVPVRVLLAALLFGLCEALSDWLSVRWEGWPPQFFLVLPYFACFAFLFLGGGKKGPPSSLGGADWRNQ